MKRSKPRQIKITIKYLEKQKTKLASRIKKLQINYSKLVEAEKQLIKELKDNQTKVSVPAALTALPQEEVVVEKE